MLSTSISLTPDPCCHRKQSPSTPALQRSPSAPTAPRPPHNPSDSISADLDANVQYLQGCWRSHARLVSVPLRPLFSIAVQAHLLPNRSVAVSCRVRINMPCGAVVSGEACSELHLLLHSSVLLSWHSSAPEGCAGRKQALWCATLAEIRCCPSSCNTSSLLMTFFGGFTIRSERCGFTFLCWLVVECY